MKAQLLNLLSTATLAYFILASTTSVKAQRSIKKTIIVTNGDTTINGKRLADMDKKERENATKEFSPREKSIIEHEIDAIINKGMQGDILVRKFRNGSAPFDIWLNKFEGDSMKLSADSITWKFRHPIADDVLIAAGSGHGRQRFHNRLVMRDDAGRLREHLNSQNFYFTSTDKEGFITETHIRVSDADKEHIRKITGKDSIESALAVEDFTLLPNFSSGRTSVSFSIASKGTLAITITDSENKTVFTEKVNSFSGVYLKALNLAKNGAYSIALSQNGKWFVKKVIKV